MMCHPYARDRLWRQLCAALVLLLFWHAPAGAVQRTQFDHLTTGYELQGAHRDLSCEYCHAGGVFKGTPRTCQGCHDIGTRVNATAKPTGHISTQDRCELCHALYNFAPVYRVDHSATRGTCFSCHNNVVAPGKRPDHIPADNNCDACHTTVAFNPVRVEHADLVAKSACRGCHAGVRAAAMPRSHLATTRECGDCHGTMTWTPARVDHSGFVANCQGCHNGSTAMGKVANHMTTSRDCATCHRYPNWSAVLFTHSSGAYPGDHRTNPPCTACHAANTETVAWQAAAFRPTCAGCHATRFKPDAHPKTTQGANYNISELQNCTGACHVYSDPKLTTIARPRPAGHHKVTDSAFR